jgi:hypothetical protein
MRAELTGRGRRLRRIWQRAGIACVVLLAAALALPRVQRALDSGPVRASRSDHALWWWCGILAAVIIAGAVAQSIGVRLGHDEDDES